MKLVKVTNGVCQARLSGITVMVVEFPTYVAVVEAPYLDNADAHACESGRCADSPTNRSNMPRSHTSTTTTSAAFAPWPHSAQRSSLQRIMKPASKKVLEAPHTHPPDDLAKAGDKAGKMETYDGKKEIKDGSQSLELVRFQRITSR